MDSEIKGKNGRCINSNTCNNILTDILFIKKPMGVGLWILYWIDDR